MRFWWMQWKECKWCRGWYLSLTSKMYVELMSFWPRKSLPSADTFAVLSIPLCLSSLTSSVQDILNTKLLQSNKLSNIKIILTTMHKVYLLIKYVLNFAVLVISLPRQSWLSLPRNLRERDSLSSMGLKRYMTRLWSTWKPREFCRIEKKKKKISLQNLFHMLWDFFMRAILVSFSVFVCNKKCLNFLLLDLCVTKNLSV